METNLNVLFYLIYIAPLSALLLCIYLLQKQIKNIESYLESLDQKALLLSELPDTANFNDSDTGDHLHLPDGAFVNFIGQPSPSERFTETL